MTSIFLHGLESSGQGRKGRYFHDHFSQMLTPDFTGDLPARMEQFSSLVKGLDDLVLVGSSFGGLMATLFAMQKPGRVARLILLAPALNFYDFSSCPNGAITTPTFIHIGARDEVTPVAAVEPIARQLFAELDFRIVDDDHVLSGTFERIDWPGLLPAAPI